MIPQSDLSTPENYLDKTNQRNEDTTIEKSSSEQIDFAEETKEHALFEDDLPTNEETPLLA